MREGCDRRATDGGRPAWSPDGTQIAVLGRVGSAEHYTAVLIYRASGADPQAWTVSGVLYNAARLEGLAWLDQDRLVALEASSADASPKPVILRRTSGGAFERERDVGTDSGCYLAAASSGVLALSTAACGESGSIVELDPSDTAAPNKGVLVEDGSDPAWRPSQP